MVERIRAKTLNEEELREFISVLAVPRGDTGEGRFSKLHALIKQRDDHFYTSDEVAQKLPAPYEDVEPYQTDIIRRSWVQAKGRMTENPWRVRVVPQSETTAAKNDANALETVLQRGVELVEDRMGLDMQSDMTDGQWLHCYGILHWQKAMDVWDKFKLISDEATEDELTKNAHDKAHAGFPFYIEVIRPDMFAFAEDRNVRNRMAYALVLRTVPIVEYSKRIKESDKLYLSLNEADQTLAIYEEKDSPSDDDPSRSTNMKGWTSEVQVAHFWTRDEFYELVRSSGKNQTDWSLVKSFKHPYEMPPFAMAPADVLNHPDPARAYLPASEGLYRIKPYYDHDVTLGRSIAESIALPLYWVKLADGSFMFDKEGNQLILSKNTLAAQALPAGAELVKVEFQMNEAFLGFLEMAGSELKDSSPDTGFVEVGASTQPWTIRLAQDQANTLIKRLKIAQGRAIRSMLRNMALVMSKPASEGGIGQTVYVYAKSKNGRLDRSTAIGIDPEKIPSLEIEVDIDPYSSAQTISNIEHMRTWLSDPMVPFTKEDFLEQAFRDPNPEKTALAADAERIFDEKIKPGLIEQELAKIFGSPYVVTAGLQFVGMGGQSATPEEVLSANGIQPVRPPEAPNPVGVAGAAQAEGAGMNNLVPLAAPNTTPLPGVPG